MTTDTSTTVTIVGHTHRFHPVTHDGLPTGFYACREPSCVHGYAGPWHDRSARWVTGVEAACLAGGLAVEWELTEGGDS